MELRRIGVLALATFTIVACTKPDPDICVAPKPETPITIASAKAEGNDNADAKFVQTVNAELAVGDCIAQAAFNARKLHDPMDQVAKGIMATCAFKFDMWQASRMIPNANQSVLESQEAERTDDLKTKSQDALAVVLKYRECAIGQKVDEPASDTPH